MLAKLFASHLRLKHNYRNIIKVGEKVLYMKIYLSCGLTAAWRPSPEAASNRQQAGTPSRLFSFSLARNTAITRLVKL